MPRRRRHRHHRLPAAGAGRAARDHVVPLYIVFGADRTEREVGHHRLPGLLRGAAQRGVAADAPRSRRSATSWPSSSRCSPRAATSSRSTSRPGSPAPRSPARQAAEQLERDGKGGERVGSWTRDHGRRRAGPDGAGRGARRPRRGRDRRRGRGAGTRGARAS